MEADMRVRSIFLIAVVAIVVGAVATLSGCGKEPAQPPVDKPVLPVATVETNMGTFSFVMYPKDAPNTVQNFVKLANQGFYNGTIFHRIIKRFMIQGGDPTGTGTGGPGYTINAEFNDRKHLVGTVSMARSADPNSAGSQFFICVAPSPHLNGQYTAFGEVIEGIDVVLAISEVKTGENDRPLEDVVMKKVTVEDRVFD
jgi:peptidyl-prolyl cis-trans isomerase B (cyclophilin B)